MGEVHDPWKRESLVSLPEELLQSNWTGMVRALETLNWSGFRTPAGQADVIYGRYLKEGGDPPNWIELDVILSALALARHPKIPDLIEQVFAMGDFDFTGVASRALLAWHGLPGLFLIWIDGLDSPGFGQMPLPAQDYIRGVDLSGTWQRVGIDCYFEDTPPEKLKQMSETFVRMEMQGTAEALNEAAKLWPMVQAVYALNLPGEAHYAAFDPLYAMWKTAAWRMNDEKNRLLGGISRFAARHGAELRSALGWVEAPPEIPPSAAAFPGSEGNEERLRKPTGSP